MTPRAIRRAAEHTARKAARKQQNAISASELTGDSAASPQTDAFTTTYVDLRENTPPVRPATTQRPLPTFTAPKANRPISQAQYTANQANAQLSTGPTSPTGRAVSARNHTTHGLTGEPVFAGFQVQPDEDQADYDRGVAAFFQEWQPVTATEIDLVERMVIHSWLRRRATRMQDQLKISDQSTLQDYKKFEILSRYYTTHARAFNKAFADLIKLRSFQMRQKKDEALLARRAQDFAFRFESQKRKAAEHVAKMETIHLKQEAQRQRNARLKPIATACPAPSLVPEALTAPASS